MTQPMKIDKSEAAAYSLARAENGLVFLQLGLPKEAKKVVAFNEFQYRQFLRDVQAIASSDLAEVVCRQR